MPTLNIPSKTYVGSTWSITWNISGLGNPFNTTYYQKAVIASSGVTDGQSTVPTFYASVTAPSSGTSTTTSTGTDTSYPVSTTVTLYGIVQAANGNWYNAGSTSVTFGAAPVAAPSALTGLVGTGVVDHIHVTWNASSGATSYTVSWTGFSSGSTTGITSLSSDVYVATNHSYTVTVTPVNSGGSGTSMTTPTITLSDRPSNFSWSTAKISGQNFSLTAAEWSSFRNSINAFRNHVGLGDYGFTTPVAGNPFYAYMFNQAVTAINAMSPPTAIPSGTAATKSTGDTIYASYLNQLVSSLNSIV